MTLLIDSISADLLIDQHCWTDDFFNKTLAISLSTNWEAIPTEKAIPTERQYQLTSNTNLEATPTENQYQLTNNTNWEAIPTEKQYQLTNNTNWQAIPTDK